MYGATPAPRASTGLDASADDASTTRPRAIAAFVLCAACVAFAGSIAYRLPTDAAASAELASHAAVATTPSSTAGVVSKKKGGGGSDDGGDDGDDGKSSSSSSGDDDDGDDDASATNSTSNSSTSVWWNGTEMTEIWELMKNMTSKSEYPSVVCAVESALCGECDFPRACG